MDSLPPLVMTLMGAIGTLAVAVASVYRERIKAGEQEIERANTRIDKLEGELVLERKARLDAAKALADASVDIITKQAAIAEVVQRAHSDTIRRAGR